MAENTAGVESEMQLTKEEQENLRLRRKLEMEQERCNELFRHLSESESSLEIEDERVFNELSSHGVSNVQTSLHTCPSFRCHSAASTRLHWRRYCAPAHVTVVGAGSHFAGPRRAQRCSELSTTASAGCGECAPHAA